MRNNRAVTLVALVITIIVLLILAGVSLAMLTGDSGILTNAEKAKKETTIANAQSAVQMAYMDIKTEVYAINAGVSDNEISYGKLQEIAEKYCYDAIDIWVDGGEVNGEIVTINVTITYEEDVLEPAIITYEKGGNPQVKLTGGERPTK